MADGSAPSELGQHPVLVRPVRGADHAAVAHFHEITLREHIAREPEFTENAPFIGPFLKATGSSGARIWDKLFGKTSMLLVAERNGVVAGHIAWTVYSRWWTPYAAIIADISIAPADRRTGIGSALLAEMERLERARGLTAIAATIWPNNTASLAFFSARGYTAPSGLPPSLEKIVLVEKKLAALADPGQQESAVASTA